MRQKTNFKIGITLVIALCIGAYLLKPFTSIGLTSVFGQLVAKTYYEILETGIQPALAPDYDFPTDYQYLNGCVAFAINNILIHKYGEGLDLLEVEKVIEKPREVLWEREYVEAFLNEYDITMKSYKRGETFFEFLEAGEPLAISYKYPLSDDKWVLHKVAAYSFDSEGVWVSDSLKGKNIRLDYSEVFAPNKKYLQYHFQTIER